MLELIKEIGAFAGLAAFLGLAVLALLSFTQGRDIRRLRDWAGSAPERDAERKESTSAVAAQRAEELRALEEARTAEHAAVEPARGAPPAARGGAAGTDPRASGSREGFSGFGERLAEPRWLVGDLRRRASLVAGGVAYAVTQGSDSDDGKGGKAQAGGGD